MREVLYKAWRWVLLMPVKAEVEVPPPDPRLALIHAELERELANTRLMRAPEPPTLRNVAP